MELATIALEKILNMFFIIILGIFLYNKEMLDKSMIHKLSKILLLIVAPILILNSFQMEYDKEKLNGFLIALLISILSFVITIPLSKVIFPKSKKRDYIIERMSVIYTNCGFMGFPLIYGLFGQEGVFYMTAYFICFSTFFWTHGIAVASGEKTFKQTIKKIINPCLLAVIIGCLMFVFEIKIHSIIYEPMKMVAETNTPLAMLVAGGTLAQQNLLISIRNLRIYLIAFIKLLVFPVLAILILSRFSLNETMVMTQIVAIGCPAAASTTLVSIMYKKDSCYASNIFAVTTILSILTIPIIILIGKYFL